MDIGDYNKGTSANKPIEPLDINELNKIVEEAIELEKEQTLIHCEIKDQLPVIMLVTGPCKKKGNWFEIDKNTRVEMLDLNNFKDLKKIETFYEKRLK